MRTRSRLAALRILELREEFSVKEIRDALSLVGEWSSSLASRAKRDGERATVGRARSSAISGSESRAVRELRDRDPERYVILTKIDQAIRLGSILPEMSDIRRAGGSLDKGFHSGESRKVAIPRLMAILATLSIGETERIYQCWRREVECHRSRNTEYDDLAEFLIKGTATRATEPTD